MKKSFLFILVLAAALASCTGRQQTPDYYVAAVIWPSCHDDSLAREKFWAGGEGEWEMIRKADPRFEGHYQPKVPYWGYEMDNDPKVVEKWIDAATSHGVNTFVFDWYWYQDKPYLESCLDDGFLGAPNNEKMSFYIMWANHDVPAKMWNYHKYGPDCDSLVFEGAVTPEIYRNLVDRWITKYFTRPNYLKFDGRPVFWLFDVKNFLKTFGNDEDAAGDAIRYLDDKCVEAGFKGVYLQVNYRFNNDKAADSCFLENSRSLMKKLQARNIATYNGSNKDPLNTNYLFYGASAVGERAMGELLGIPVVPTVSLGWDNTPRYPRLGEKNTVHILKNPENFKIFLKLAKYYLDEHPDQPRLILINAWNEWIEDAYLLPDQKYGFGYLEAVKEVFGAEN